MLPAGFAGTVGDDGLYLYRHILHPDWDDMAFIGWAPTFSNSLTSHLSALWLSKLLAGQMARPSKDQMRRKVAEMKVWKRGFMPAMGSRASMLQLHRWHFHDDLLRDMGFEPRRKVNAVADLLTEYGPADYADVFHHAWHNR